MAFPSIDGIRKEWAVLPELGDTEIQAAITAAKRTLPAEQAGLLRDSLNAAFRDYFRSRLWQLWAAKAPAGQTAKHVAQIAAAADKLARLLGVVDGPEKMPGLLKAILARETRFHAERIGGFPNLPPFDFVAVRGDGGERILHKDYRGDEKIAECLEGLTLLRQLLHSAHEYERSKVKEGKEAEKAKTQKRNEGDQAMPPLFDRLNGIWSDTFGERPGTSWNAYAGDAGGPYTEFLLALFGALKANLPAAISAEYPKLGKGLPTTAQAVRARFRACGIRKVQ